MVVFDVVGEEEAEEADVVISVVVVEMHTWIPTEESYSFLTPFLLLIMPSMLRNLSVFLV
jgi:hypothetical protein